MFLEFNQGIYQTAVHIYAFFFQFVTDHLFCFSEYIGIKIFPCEYLGAVIIGGDACILFDAVAD